MRHLFHIFLFTQFAFSQPAVVCKHWLYGIPTGTGGGNTLIVRDIYALSNDPHTKFASWIAYRVEKENIGKSEGRKWAPDPWLDPAETLEPEDYDGAPQKLKIDRGHQAPLASFSGTKDAHETNYLSNITPQSSELNQGAWVKIENAERKLSKSDGAVYVLTGPVYARQMQGLPKADEPHTVPSGYWKIIYDDTLIATTLERDRIEDSEFFYKAHLVSLPRFVVAFIFDQSTSRNESPLNHVVSVDSVEKISGLDFFSDLPDETENAIEAQTSKSFAERLLK